MVIREQDNSLELLCLEALPPDSPGAGDIRLQIRVDSHGFSGEGAVWIEAETFRSFVGRLRLLEVRRQGMAEVQAMPVEEFRLRMRAVDRAGHMVLEGHLTRRVPATRGREPLPHSLQFGFEFCPSLLPGLVAEFESLPKASS